MSHWVSHLHGLTDVDHRLQDVDRSLVSRTVSQPSQDLHCTIAGRDVPFVGWTVALIGGTIDRVTEVVGTVGLCLNWCQEVLIGD